MSSMNMLSIFCIATAFIAGTSAQSKTLAPNEIASIANADNHTNFATLLEHIIQPRVAGTPSHEVVKNYIINQLKASNFNVELDSFAERVPILGNVTFTNIIGRLNPNAEKFLALACHYDTKYFPGEVFYGATDSAVPCSIMLNLVHTLQSTLSQMKSRNDVSLMLIFFDGEEAFREWTQTDSLYGSRHLAAKWGLARSKAHNTRLIDEMEVMVLLDLIGAPNPKFYDFYENTERIHLRLIEIEKYLHTQKFITSKNYMFVPQVSYSVVDDDHRPFLEKNVPILHLIPRPFPKVWHKMTDNLENLSIPTIQNFIKIMRVFIVDYFTIHEPTTTFRV